MGKDKFAISVQPTASVARSLRDSCTDPDLQFDAFVVLVDSLHFEVDADCTDERRRKRVVRVAEQERRLADAAVADDQQLEHIVEVLIGRIFRRRRLHDRLDRAT